MKFQFEVADRSRTVEVHRQVEGYQVVLDGRAHLVDAVRVSGQIWSLLVRDVEQQSVRSVEAVVVPQKGNGTLDVYVAGHRIEVRQPSAFGRRGRGGEGAQGAGPQRITAPMPGKIVRILVKPGDTVQPRQGLIVVEAMKMENELRAAREGRVKDVLVAEHQSVEAGTALVIVE